MVGHRYRVWVYRVGALVITLTTLGGLFAWRFDRWVGSLRFVDAAHDVRFTHQEFPFLSQEQVAQLGAAHTTEDHPRSSYIEHSERKAPGTVRIGVFGCSFVKGAEAGPGNDAPSLVEEALHDAGAGHVEVLNFGVSGHGFHQAFLLWEFLHDRFDLDYTVFDLFGFHAQRDPTFLMLEDIYAPVLARYVIDDGRPRLVAVLGGDRLEASQRYFRMLLAWQYLRYDLKTALPSRAAAFRQHPSQPDLPPT